MTRTPRIIAEIGTGHGGDIARADELIRAASEAGADAAKFQYVIADEILHPAAGSVNLPGGPVALFARFRELEQPHGFYEQLVGKCTNAGIAFLCSAFGPTSARAVRSLGVGEFKVASPELNHMPLLAELAGYSAPLILSTGVATLSDIDEAVRCVRAHAAAETKLELLHCVTAYPADENDYNLAVLPHMRALFDIPVGVSDHSLDACAVPLVAVAHGATTIEKHITLSRDDAGLDDPIALTYTEFARMVREVNAAARVPRAAIRDHVIEVLGAERFNAISGSGAKQLAPGERANYGRTNRSIHALTGLPVGTVLTHGNVAILRTERELTPGLHPRHWSTVLGCTVTREVGDGEGIAWHHLTQR